MREREFQWKRAALWFLFGAALCGQLVYGQAGSAADEFRVGYSGRLFTEARIRDAQVAIERWARQLVASRESTHAHSF